VRSPEGVALTRIPLENTGAPHLEARKAEGRDESKRSEAWLLFGRSTPFLKADFPTRAPKRHRQSLPRRAPGFPPYDTGARPHLSYRLTRSTKKENHRTRSVQLPRGYAPLHFWGNQRSGRRTTAQGACNRPWLCAPSSSPKPAIETANRCVGSV
jgi:hypothetical protein